MFQLLNSKILKKLPVHIKIIILIWLSMILGVLITDIYFGSKLQDLDGNSIDPSRKSATLIIEDKSVSYYLVIVNNKSPSHARVVIGYIFYRSTLDQQLGLQNLHVAVAKNSQFIISLNLPKHSSSIHVSLHLGSVGKSFISVYFMNSDDYQLIENANQWMEIRNYAIYLIAGIGLSIIVLLMKLREKNRATKDLELSLYPAWDDGNI